MNVLLIPDKFKGSLSAEEVINCISNGVKKVFPKTKIASILASDGGDGFLESVARYREVEEIVVDTVDPLGKKIRAPFHFDLVSKSAFVEMAQASGLVLLKEAERNPLQTSTFGTGIQIQKAIELGARSIYLGLGGSATNDGGCGIAKALGWEFLDKEGKDLYPTGRNLSKIKSIVPSKLTRGISFYAVNDVNNPLLGPLGASHVYAKQKGASTDDILFLESALIHLAELVKTQLNKDVAKVPGAGAAGGAAYGLKAFCNASFLSGIDYILNLAQVDELVKKHNFQFIITGEGKIDVQSIHGKLISGVVDLGKRHDIPIIGVCGKLDLSEKEKKKLPMLALLEAGDPSESLKYNMENAAELLEASIYKFFSSL
ncbi:MAG: glycerate kinase [Bacteroidota bacterium]